MYNFLNFQFSLWDSTNLRGRWVSFFHLSILFMRFYKQQRDKSFKMLDLSILFMRFYTYNNNGKEVNIFQFSLWDSTAFVKNQPLFITSNFQFSLWDSDFETNSVNAEDFDFQFSLWDSKFRTNPPSFGPWPFNSLYEILGE
mgnify:CR=1 FL=1